MTTWIVDTDALRGRASAPAGKVLYTRSRGFKLGIIGTKTAGGRLWGRTKAGTWYCLAYCRRAIIPASPSPSGSRRVSSPCPGRSVTTPYGRRKAGLWRTKGYHTGDDYAAPAGTPVGAVRGGVAYRLHDSVLGNVIVLYADNGDTYWYCHLQTKGIASGTRVKAGRQLGKVGATGTGALGPHLHFERHRGHSTSWWAKDVRPTW